MISRSGIKRHIKKSATSFTLASFITILMLHGINFKSEIGLPSFLKILLTATPTPEIVVPTSISPYANWSTDQSLIINNPQGAWLREEPNSSSLVIVTALNDRDSVIVASIPPQYDGFQYWWLVTTSDKQFTGYIEETSLGPPGKRIWNINQVLIVNKSPTVWLRSTPDSESEDFVVILNGTIVTVIGGPESDDVQWWWQIQTTIRGTSYSGWTEQNSLTERRIPNQATNTLVPSASLTVPIPTSTIPSTSTLCRRGDGGNC